MLCLLAYCSLQRPGVVTNVTLEEYEAIKEVWGSDEVIVHVSDGRLDGTLL